MTPAFGNPATTGVEEPPAAGRLAKLARSSTTVFGEAVLPQPGCLRVASGSSPPPRSGHERLASSAESDPVDFGEVASRFLAAGRDVRKKS
jgi:hypothetical protein